MSKETILSNLISNDVYVCASVMVRELSEGLTLNSASFAELYHECLMGDDYEAPVVDELPDLDTAGLESLADFIGMDYDDALSTESVRLHLVHTGDWESACDYLDLEPHTIEALEHWLVSDPLARELESIGALVATDVLGFNIWGRTESGQSLEYDSDLNAVSDQIQARIDAL